MYCSSPWFDSIKTSTKKLKLRIIIGFLVELIRTHAFRFMNRVISSKNVYYVGLCNSSVPIH